VKLTQKHLGWGAGILLYGTVVWSLWSGLISKAGVELESVPREIEKTRAKLRDAGTKLEREKSVYDARKAEWLADHKKKLAEVNDLRGADWEVLTRDARARIESLRGALRSAEAALALDRTDVDLRNELWLKLNDVARKHAVSDADRKFTITIRPSGRDGLTEIAVQFSFKLPFAAAASVLEGELTESLPYVTIDSVRLKHAHDQKAGTATADLMELTGNLLGYVRLRSPTQP